MGIIHDLLTAILGIIVLSSPLVTIWLNNRHAVRMKELEHHQDLYKTKYLHEREMIENYLSAVAYRIAHPSQVSNEEYNRAYLSVLFLLPDDLRGSLVTINKELEQKETDAAKTHLVATAGQLRAYLNALTFTEPAGKSRKAG